MARSPFQGTWQPNLRPTIAHSPDALVFINGETDILGCPSCRRRFDFNKYVTSIQVDLSVESAPGSASVSLSIPRHSVDDFFFDGNPLVSPMMEIEIFAKGYFLLEGLPQYYPIFWGLITEVGDSYSGGEHTVSLTCSDILKWWELCKMNVNSASTQPTGQQGRSIFGNVFYGTNPYDVIWTLAQQSFGDVVIGSGSLVSLFKEQSQRDTFNRALGDIMQYWNERFTRIRSNLLMYGTQGVAVRGTDLWDRYQRKPSSVTRDKKYGSHFASQSVRKANGGDEATQLVFDPTDPNVVAFRTQFMEAGQVNFWQSEYQTKLELANAAKEAIGFEFFMDVTGDIVFKPPFFNLDIMANKPVSWIQDIDVIDWDFGESEAEVVTQLSIQGSFRGATEFGMGEETTPFTSVTDYHLLRRYGWRSQTFNSEFMGSLHLMFYVGMDLLDRYNAKRWRSTINIPIRPELRLGFPVYVAPKDQVWYISGISHNIQMGGRAQTTLTLTAKREKFVAPQGIGSLRLTGLGGTVISSDENPGAELEGTIPNLTVKQLQEKGTFELTIGDAAELPARTVTDALGDPYAPLIVRHPKTRRLLGYPNVVMVYTRPFSEVTENRLFNAAGQKTSQGVGAQQRQQNVGDKDDLNKALRAEAYNTASALNTATFEDLERDTHLVNRYSYGLNSAGVYTYAHDVDSLLKEIILLPRKNITVVKEVDGDSSVETENDAAQRVRQGLTKMLKNKATGMIRPISDERGFGVVGHFKYGRGVALRDGSLVLSGPENNLPGGFANTRTNVDLQVALSGDLIDVLTSQSQGITTFSSAYANPVEAITNLQPEELQTAATIEPNTGEVQLDPIHKNFVDTRPLGSVQEGGMPVNVEAGQLSQALTLAEMTARESESEPDPTCACLTGRSDLAFLNVGFEINSLGAVSSGDPTEIGSNGGTFVSGFEQVPEDFQANVEAARAEVEARLEAIETEKRAEFEARLVQAENDARVGIPNDYTDLLDSSPEEQEALLYLEIVEAQETQRDTIASEVAAANFPSNLQNQATQALNTEINANNLQGNSLVEPVVVGEVNPSQRVNQVETFLTQLYRALDDPHQEYEKAIRGEYLEVPSRSAQEIRFPELYPRAEQNLEPPFSALNRARGGDPLALAQEVVDQADNVKEVWDRTGAEIRQNAQRAKLEAEIQQNMNRLTSLRADRTRLEEARGSLVAVPIDVERQLEQINEEIDRLSQQVQRDQLRLQTGNF